MPDWSYQTLLRPLLFQLPAARARALTLRALGVLAAHRLGPQLIALMGHTAPAPSLGRTAWDITFPSPVGLSADLPDNILGVGSLARFGVGFVEVGPVIGLRQASSTATALLDRRSTNEAIWVSETRGSVDVDTLLVTLEPSQPLPIPLGIRLGYRAGADAGAAARERTMLIERLACHAAFFTLTPPPLTSEHAWTDADWQAHLAVVHACAQAVGKPLIVGVTPDGGTAILERILRPALALGISGVQICGGVADRDGGRLLGCPARAATHAMVSRIRAHWGDRFTIIAAGGVHAPSDALDLLAVGAAFVQLDSGLVYAGPGLPKRTNEAIRFQQESSTPRTFSSPRTWPRESWFWLLLLGMGMMVGGVLAWLIAAMRVVLPYDEAFIGMARAQLTALNPRLLQFMAHDRVTLAGTMISIGILYAQLAVHAVRAQAHWARQVIAISAAVGFLSFFLYLGFGYFDPLHALASLLLLPLFLLGLRGRVDGPPAIPVPDLQNDRAWSLAQWGQLGFVGLGIGLVMAGLAIALIGITRVFVTEDLAFLRTTPAVLHEANARLVALIAHDRAGFGGALVSNGLAVLLLALWGVRRGARWVWWTLLLAGLPGFAGALGVHAAIGYLDLWHLSPALLAMLIYGASLALLYPYLAAQRSQDS